MFIGKRTVSAGVSVDLRAVDPQSAQLQHAHLTRQKQHLNQQPFDLLEESLPERRDGVVVGMIVSRDKTETPPSHKSPAPASGSKISPSHSHKPECPAASSDGRTPNPSRDSFRSSREGPSRQSPPPQTAPDASPVATRLPTAAEEIRSRGQSCGNYSSGRHSLQWRIIAPILSQTNLSR